MTNNNPKTLGEKLSPPKLKRSPLQILLRLLSWPFAPRRRANYTANQHSLIADDHQGFMRDLRLDAKTAVLDGSNVYHFGHDLGLDAEPLGLIAHRLRDEGYRIICFFDANIFYTLREHGAFGDKQPHTIETLTDIFGLRANEIFVVPSGVQADKYVLNAITHLPISFAVSNDRFRDFSKTHAGVMKGNQWRKGVTFQKGEIRLFQHRFKSPIKVGN